MKITDIRHKGLRQLYEDNNTKGVRASTADKLRKLVFAMETAGDLNDLALFPGWRLHPLKDLIDYHSEAPYAHEHEYSPPPRRTDPD